MAGFREEFYKALQKNYDDYHSKSTVYRFLKEENEEKAAAVENADLKRCNGYIQMKLIISKYKKKQLSYSEYLSEIFMAMAEHADKHIINKLNFDDLYELCLKLCEKNDVKAPKKNKAKSKEIFRLLGRLALTETVIAKELTNSKLTRIIEEYLDNEMAYECKSFFYDSMNRKTDRMLALVDMYCRDCNLSPKDFILGLSQSDNSEFDKEGVNILYKLLNNSSIYKDVLIPVKHDLFSGTSIYIVGLNFCMARKRFIPESYRDVCKFCVLMVITASGATFEVEGSLNILANFEGDMYFELEDAYKAFEAKKETISDVRSLNGETPENCPKAFQTFFINEGDDLEDDLLIASLDKDDIDKLIKEEQNDINRINKLKTDELKHN